eukprot:4070741-Amphidinium_carterae.1
MLLNLCLAQGLMQSGAKRCVTCARVGFLLGVVSRTCLSVDWRGECAGQFQKFCVCLPRCCLGGPVGVGRRFHPVIYVL